MEIVKGHAVANVLRPVLSKNTYLCTSVRRIFVGILFNCAVIVLPIISGFCHHVVSWDILSFKVLPRCPAEVQLQLHKVSDSRGTTE